MEQQLITVMETAIREVRQYGQKTVRIFHHNDADGLSSGAILTRAFEREGFEAVRFCLEKPYPAVLKKVFAQEGQLLVFADFAGRIAPILSDLNRGRNLTLILDHHVAEASTDPRVYNLDPDLFGLKGDRDISASTTCYLFARTLNPANRDLAHMAVIGAVGDNFVVDGRLASQNRDAVMEAADQGKLHIVEKPDGERYIFHAPTGDIPYDELAIYLNVLGGAGYYKSGPEIGIQVCLEGMSHDSDRMVAELNVIRDTAFEAEFQRLQQGGLRHTPRLQWFHVEDRFAPMGVMMVGYFCSLLKRKDFIDPQKYIAGIQNLPDLIPRFGPIEFNEVKVSMRISPLLETEITEGRAMPLNALLPEATSRLGGFSDACHRLSAATTVAKGKEEQLIEEMEKVLCE